MDAFHEQLTRRIAQFEHYLRQMEERRRQLGKDCFIVFHEDDRSGDGPAKALDRSKAKPRQMARMVSGDLEPGDFSGTAGDGADDSGENDDTQESGPRRYIQFAFWEHFFVMDMTVDTLWLPEARRIQRDRDGFFFVGERPDYPYYRKDVPEHNPFQKQFVNGDEETAAQDTAYVFFQIWNFPVTSRLFVTASSFFTHHRWERSVPLD